MAPETVSSALAPQTTLSFPIRVGLGETPNGSPLQYSCLENPMDRGAWRATVHTVARSWTRLSDSHTHTHTASARAAPSVQEGLRREDRNHNGDLGCSAASFLVSQENCYSTTHLVATGHKQGGGETGLVESQEGQLLSSAPTKGWGCGKVTSYL